MSGRVIKHCETCGKEISFAPSRESRYSVRFCSRKCYWNESPSDRFWKRVERLGPIPSHLPNLGNCWIWTGNKIHSGYGQIGVGGKMISTHRFSFMLSNGDPGDMCVLHRCDNPSCVRPDHLFLGTHSDNMRDRDSKNRQASGDRSGARTCPESRARGLRHGFAIHPELRPVGERHGRSKLTKEQVMEIRCAIGSQRSIAKQYGVSQSLVGFIRRGELWKRALTES